MAKSVRRREEHDRNHDHGGGVLRYVAHVVLVKPDLRVRNGRAEGGTTRLISVPIWWMCLEK